MKWFLIFLILAVWQDLFRRSVDLWLLCLFGIIGGGLCMINGRAPEEIFFSVLPGWLLLGAGRVTEGGIGEGDGWFFIISGLFLSGSENLILLVSGLLLCGLYCLVLAVGMMSGLGMGIQGTTRKIAVPFLPFLLPAGLWLALI